MSSWVRTIYHLFVWADSPVPDIHYKNLQEECIADHKYNSAFLSGMLEVLMSQGTSNEEGWSQEALEFSSIPLSESIDQYVQVKSLVSGTDKC